MESGGKNPSSDPMSEIFFLYDSISENPLPCLAATSYKCRPISEVGRTNRVPTTAEPYLLDLASPCPPADCSSVDFPLNT